MAPSKERAIERLRGQRKGIAKKYANCDVEITRVRVDIRAEVERELAVLRAPGASKKLRAAFDATPEQLAAAANAAEAHRKR